MIDNIFAEAHESPSKEIIYGGKRDLKFMWEWGGSLAAMLRGSKSRYFHLKN